MDGWGKNDIKFKEGISKEDLVASRIPSTANLRLSIKGSSDSITFEGIYNSPGSMNFKFSNGEILSLKDFKRETSDNDECHYSDG